MENEGKTDKHTTYFNHLRFSIIEEIPRDTQIVLSVGCAEGVTEEELVKRGVHVVGIEMNHEAAQTARSRGIEVLEGDVEQIDVQKEGMEYDCLIYADVLEHLRDPIGVLRKHLTCLKRDGLVVISIPNFRHYTILWKLFILGRIAYESAGILDYTHYHITTKKTVFSWFEDIGIKPIKAKPKILSRRNRLFNRLTVGLFDDFLSSQVVLVGKKGS